MKAANNQRGLFSRLINPPMGKHTPAQSHRRDYAGIVSLVPKKSAPRISSRTYNIDVANSPSSNQADHKHRRHAAYATETAGLLLIAFLLLVLSVIRYWHAIHWSLR